MSQYWSTGLAHVFIGLHSTIEHADSSDGPWEELPVQHVTFSLATTAGPGDADWPLHGPPTVRPRPIPEAPKIVEPPGVRAIRIRDEEPT